MLKLGSCLGAVVILSVLASAACDKGSKSDTTTVTSASGAAAVKGSCNMLSALGTCTEYTDDDGISLDKSLCEGFKGTFTTAACPGDQLVGSCAMSEGETKRYYVTKDELSSFTQEEAKADCESELVKGKYTASANAPKNVQNTPTTVAADAPAANPAAKTAAKAAPTAAAAKAH